MRLSPISQSGLSAWSGKRSASKRWPESVPQTQVPAPAKRRVVFVISRSKPTSKSSFVSVIVWPPVFGGRRHRGESPLHGQTVTSGREEHPAKQAGICEECSAENA